MRICFFPYPSFTPTSSFPRLLEFQVSVKKLELFACGVQTQICFTSFHVWSAVETGGATDIPLDSMYCVRLPQLLCFPAMVHTWSYLWRAAARASSHAGTQGSKFWRFVFLLPAPQEALAENETGLWEISFPALSQDQLLWYNVHFRVALQNQMKARFSRLSKMALLLGLFLFFVLLLPFSNDFSPWVQFS